METREEKMECLIQDVWEDYRGKGYEAFKDVALKLIKWADENPLITENTSDGYHTFKELYDYRLVYNAALFNELAKCGVRVIKSWRHSDGEKCFNSDDWFIVQAELPAGQISNHYEAKHWDLFKVPEVAVADEWDGHTPQDVLERLMDFILNFQEGGE